MIIGFISIIIKYYDYNINIKLKRLTGTKIILKRAMSYFKDVKREH